ncbi:MAG: sporulation protein YunB [Clostridia bacterium]|nr:sporulation protein YunB [Clostridia bacterium]
MRRKYKKIRRKFPVFLFALISLVLAISIYYTIVIRPILEEYVNAELANSVNLIINGKTAEIIEKNGVTYESLISLSRDKEGRILSLYTNVSQMNALKLDIEKGILSMLQDTDSIAVEVPVGSLMGGEFLSGIGPCIKVHAVPITRLFTEFENEFDSSGINQTRHRILLKYNISLKILLPGKRDSMNIKEEICIAETIIVGNIPNFYAGK